MNGIYRTLGTLSAVALIGTLCAAAGAGAASCAHCGCGSSVKYVCRPVCTIRYEEVTCWDCVDEVFCVPPRSKCGGGKHCKGAGSGGGDCSCTGGHGPCAGSCVPCGKVRTRKKLLRKTFIREVPVIIWVVEPVCAGCRDRRCESVPEVSPAECETSPIRPIPPVPPEQAPAPLPPAVLIDGKSRDVRQAGFVEPTSPRAEEMDAAIKVILR